MKQKWIDAYMDTAKRFAELSSAERLKVGAVIVKENRIISIGYNGMPSGWDNCCEEVESIPDWAESIDDIHPDDRDTFVRYKTKDEVIHAEANAIIKLARDGESGQDADIFVTHSPCISCAKMIQGVGIKNVYYSYDYRSTEGIEFLKKSKINVKKCLDTD